jgi:hypothetical protein
MTNYLLPEAKETIQKTLLTAKLIDGFWDRWRAHGIEDSAISEVRSNVITLERWVGIWQKHALENKQLAELFGKKQRVQEAEYYYRLSALYYNLIQWIFPKREEAKQRWFLECLETYRIADAFSLIETQYASIEIDGFECYGRIRIPKNPVGCVIIFNPLDSSKEELFTYETDFAERNLVTVSFDGPGQGETYTFGGLLGSRKRWMEFTDTIIDYASNLFPNLPLHLFGTSSGAAWAIYGSGNSKVTKSAAVSPATRIKELPGYFMERMNSVMEPNESILPDFEAVKFQKPVFLFHGLKDVMVSTQDMVNLYERFPQGKRYMEFADEGHCCNYKLNEIRKLSKLWFMDK